MGLGLEMRDHILRAVKCRLQLPENGTVGTKEIKKGNGQDQEQAGHETHGEKNDLHVRDQFPVVCKLVGLDQVKDKEGYGYNTVVDAVF